VVHAARVGSASRPGDGPDDEPARVGFVVSRAVGGAVVRNRVKRRLRASVAQRLGDLPAGVVVVVRAQPAAAAASRVVLEADLSASLERAMRSLQPAGPAAAEAGRR
jgi:ribonuclease P protein component